jgi:hypothetical protein
VGDLVLGGQMDRAAEALRELGDLRSVRTTESSTPSWFVVRPSGLSIRVDSDAGDRVVAIEFGSGLRATDKVVYRDISLFDEPVDEVLRRLRQTTEVVDSDDEPGYSFHRTRTTPGAVATHTSRGTRRFRRHVLRRRIDGVTRLLRLLTPNTRICR